MYISPIHNVIYFRAKTTDENNEKKKVTPQDAAVATGAAGATGSAMAGKGTMKSFSEVNHKANSAARNLKKSVKLASETTSEAKGIIGKFKNGCQHYKKWWCDLGANVSNSNLLKPILQSNAYKGAAKVAGGATAGFVAINGIGEMFSTFAKRAEQFSKD